MESVRELKELQRLMASMLFRPLDAKWRMQRTTAAGARTADAAAGFIKPNDRLTSFERLEIYNRQYWFRVLDCLYDDYPGLRAILGERKFMRLCRAYLVKYPSASFTLRDLGSRLEKFLRDEPDWAAPRAAMALDMARFEWAQIVAFDGPSKPAITMDDVLDTPPEKLRLGVQPCITLLALDHEVDHFLQAVRKRDGDVLRGEASNAIDHAPKSAGKKSRLRPPRIAKVFLAVHRCENELYYKRLDPVAFQLLAGLRDGLTLDTACALALGGNPDPALAGELRSWFSEWSELGWFCKFSKLQSP
ncbi:MAG: DNA-binding domain-containing protein [Terrimicrobiaceae bacterium]|nr:DNA-binding domain-containing protein [Terrimicrobiaceae bacterium]